MHYSPTTCIVWEDLSERFSKVDGTRIFHLTRDVYHVRKGTLSIAQYFGKFKDLWDELAIVDDDCLCADCSISPRVITIKNKQMLIQFLIGLNETFAAVRSNLLMMNPLPSLNYAYSLLIQEENQRQVVSSITSSLDGAVLYSSAGDGAQSNNNSRFQHAGNKQPRNKCD